MTNATMSTTHVVPVFSGLAALLILVAAVKLVTPIIYPRIVHHPWSAPQENADDKKKTVAFAGSFNPPHNGHIAMMLYLCQRYGKVMVVVGKNPKKQYKVLPEERVALIQRMLQEKAPQTSNIEVLVVSGLIWRTVKRRGAHVFIRGIRSWEKDGSEEQSLQILNTWGPIVLGPLWWPLPTVFLEGKPEYNHVSSTLVRNICRGGGGGELETLVPASVVGDVEKMYGDV